MARPWLLLAACLAAGSALSLWLGQDANWDLLHYHLYDPMALLGPRGNRDVAAAGMQGFFNPLLDLPYAWLATHWLNSAPRTLAAAMGLWTGLLLWLVIRISARLYQGPLGVAAVLLGVTGVAAVGEAGTTFNDTAIAVLTLGGLLVTLPRSAGPPAARLAAGGVLFGLAAGFKPTAAPYAAAFCLSLVAILRPAALIPAWLRFGSFWVCGAMASGGWWAFRLSQDYANPVFPLFNAVFQSPWYPPADFVDTRHIPAGWLHTLFAPLWWAWQVTRRTTEAPSNDPRMAVALLLGYAAMVCCLARRRWPGLPPAARQILAFTAAGYALWLLTSGIARYAIPVEAGAGLCVPLLIMLIWPGRGAALVGTAAALLGCAAVTHYADWGRRPFGARVLAADAAFVAPGTLFVVLDPPSSYVLPLLPHQYSIAAVGLLHTTLEARGWRLHDTALARVAAQSGPILVLVRTRTPFRPALAELGLDPALGPCHAIVTAFDTAPSDLAACEARHAPPPALTDPFWPRAAAYYRTVQSAGAVWPFTGLAYLQAGGRPARGTRFVEPGTLLWGFDPSFPATPDSQTLYILGDQPDAMTPGPDDAVLQRDGVTVLAPGWRRCVPCMAASPG